MENDLDYLKVAAPAGLPRCDCGEGVVTVHCKACDNSFCVECDKDGHRRGDKQRHVRVSISEWLATSATENCRFNPAAVAPPGARVTLRAKKPPATDASRHLYANDSASKPYENIHGSSSQSPYRNEEAETAYAEAATRRSKAPYQNAEAEAEEQARKAALPYRNVDPSTPTRRAAPTAAQPAAGTMREKRKPPAATPATPAPAPAPAPASAPAPAPAPSATNPFGEPEQGFAGFGAPTNIDLTAFGAAGGGGGMPDALYVDAEKVGQQAGEEWV
jgi:hypothetical protein